MKRILFLLSFLAVFSSSLLAYAQGTNSALNKHDEQMIIEEYARFEREKQSKAHIDKSMPIDFGQVEDVWQRHAQRRPYNGTITSSLPLDPAYSSAFSPQKKKEVVHARKTKISTKKKVSPTKSSETKAKEEVSSQTTKQTDSPTTSATTSLPTVRPSGPMTIQKAQTTKKEDENIPLSTLTTLDTDIRKADLTAEEALAAEEEALKILRTSDNTIEALEKLFEENPKLKDEVRRLRLSQEAAIEDELNLPKPEYIEIIN